MEAIEMDEELWEVEFATGKMEWVIWESFPDSDDPFDLSVFGDDAISALRYE